MTVNKCSKDDDTSFHQIYVCTIPNHTQESIFEDSSPFFAHYVSLSLVSLLFLHECVGTTREPEPGVA